jgi:hypothetical protein
VGSREKVRLKGLRTRLGGQEDVEEEV